MNTASKTKTPTRNFSKRMGQVLVVGGVLTLVLAGPLQPHVAAIRSAEGIYIPDSHYQFSAQEVTNKDGKLSHVFTLYNGRPQSLQVEVSADCGCTGLSWQSATLPPFGRKQVIASMNPSNRSQSVGVTFTIDNKELIFADLKTQ